MSLPPCSGWLGVWSLVWLIPVVCCTGTAPGFLQKGSSGKEKKAICFMSDFIRVRATCLLERRSRRLVARKRLDMTGTEAHVCPGHFLQVLCCVR